LCRNDADHGDPHLFEQLIAPKSRASGGFADFVEGHEQGLVAEVLENGHDVF
jgi:hypothetical protein